MVAIKDGEAITCDRVLLATGRTPATDNLGLESIGLETDRRGFISVNEDFETAAEGVYAIGDCIGGAMLAQKAMEEGIVCVNRRSDGRKIMYLPLISAAAAVAATGQARDRLCLAYHTLRLDAESIPTQFSIGHLPRYTQGTQRNQPRRPRHLPLTTCTGE